MDEWIKVICSGCNVKLKIQLKHTGKRGKCPKCHIRFVIPKKREDSAVFDLLKDLEEIDKEIEAKEKKAKEKKSETQEINNGWDTGTKINIDNL